MHTFWVNIRSAVFYKSIILVYVHRDLKVYPRQQTKMPSLWTVILLQWMSLYWLTMFSCKRETYTLMDISCSPTLSGPFHLVSFHFISLSLCLSLLFVSPESCLWTLCRIAVLPVYGTAAINSSKCHAKAQRPCSNKTTAEAEQAWLGCRGSLCSPTKQGQSISSVSM